MPLSRREFVAGALSATAIGSSTAHSEANPMYGLISKLIANAGQRDVFVSTLLEATTAMPGCLSYVIATDPSDPNALWITEVWETKDAHAASLSLPAVQAAMRKGRPLIASFASRTITTPVGGHGIANRTEHT